MSKETRTRSAPDLSLLRVAFLWTTRNGVSEVAKEAETRMKIVRAEIRRLAEGIAIVVWNLEMQMVKQICD